MRLIDADKLLTKAQDYGEGQEKLILIDPYYVKKAETVQAIVIPDNATNGDVIKAMFPDIKIDTEAKNSDWWNAPYEEKGDSSNGSN